MEFPGALGWVESAVQRPGITRHLAAVAAWVGQGEGELPVEELKPLLRILVEAVPRLQDPLRRREATRLFTAVLARGGKTCHEGSLAMLMQCSKKVSSATAMALLFSWTCHLAAQAALPEGGTLQGPAFQKLVILQCQLLARVAQAGKHKLTSTTVAKAHALFARFPGTLARYLEAITAATDETEVEGGVRMVAAYFSHQSRATSAEYAPVKASLLALYNTGALAATQGSKGRAVSRGMTLAFQGLMRWLTHEDFSVLLEEIMRILRRTPEYIMQSLALAVTHLTIDMSQYIGKFTDIVSERILQEPFQKASIALVKALASQSSDVSAVVPLGSALGKLLAAKAKTWQDKVAVMGCLRELLTMSKSRGLAPLAMELLPVLTAAVDREVKEEAKCEGVRLLGACILRADTCGADTLKVLTKCLEAGTDNVRGAALVALGEAVKAPGVRAASVALVDALLKVVQMAEKKPAYRSNTPSALRLLLLYAADDAGAAKKWAEAKLWRLLTAHDSYVGALCLRDAATAEELLPLADVIETLIKDYKSEMASEDQRRGVHALLARLLVHPGYVVHRAAAQVLSAYHTHAGTRAQAHTRTRAHSLTPCV